MILTLIQILKVIEVSSALLIPEINSTKLELNPDALGRITKFKGRYLVSRVTKNIAS